MKALKFILGIFFMAAAPFFGSLIISATGGFHNDHEVVFWLFLSTTMISVGMLYVLWGLEDNK